MTAPGNDCREETETSIGKSTLAMQLNVSDAVNIKPEVLLIEIDLRPTLTSSLKQISCQSKLSPSLLRVQKIATFVRSR